MAFFNFFEHLHLALLVNVFDFPFLLIKNLQPYSKSKLELEFNLAKFCQ